MTAFLRPCATWIGAAAFFLVAAVLFADDAADRSKAERRPRVGDSFALCSYPGRAELRAHPVVM